jgi:hypothetical protein
VQDDSGEDLVALINAIFYRIIYSLVISVCSKSGCRIGGGDVFMSIGCSSWRFWGWMMGTEAGGGGGGGGGEDKWVIRKEY